MDKMNNSHDFFGAKTLKAGDIFCYTQNTCFRDVSEKARRLGGKVEYIEPSDKDYHKTNGMGVRVITPIP